MRRGDGQARWTPEEIHKLARRESEHSVKWQRHGTRRNMNVTLQAEFPQRTLEAMKGRRMYDACKKMLQQMIEGIPRGSDEPMEEESNLLPPPSNDPTDDPFLTFF